MAKHTIPWLYPAKLAPDRFARNGRYPNPSSWGRIANAFNAASMYRRRMVLAFGVNGTFLLPGTSADTTIRNYFLFRTQKNVDRLVAVLGVGPAEDASSTDGKARITCTPVAGGDALNGSWVRNSRVNASQFAPAEVAWGTSTVSGLSDDTLYVGAIELHDYSVVASACIYQEAPVLADDSLDTICDPTPFEVYGEIEAAHIEKVVKAGIEIHKTAGAQLISWPGRDQVSATSYTNVIDGTSTSNTSATPGFQFTTQYHDRAVNSLSVELAAKVRRTAGTGTLKLGLMSPDGTIFDSLNPIDGNDTVVESGTWSANEAPTKYDLVGRVSDSSTTYEVEAFAVWEYDS